MTMMDGRVQKTRQHKVFANQRDLTKMPEQCLAQAAPPKPPLPTENAIPITFNDSFSGRCNQASLSGGLDSVVRPLFRQPR